MSLYRKARPDEIQPVNTAVNTMAERVNRKPPAGQQTPAGVLSKDRHRPGYMAEYMRKYRARK